MNSGNDNYVRINNVTDTYHRARYVDILEYNTSLLTVSLSQYNEELSIYDRGRMTEKLRGLLEYTRQYVNATCYQYGKHYLSVSIRKLAGLYGGGYTTWVKYIHIWIEWGLLGRPDHHITENNLFEENAMYYARLNGMPNATTAYTILPWTAGKLESLRPIRGSGTKASIIHRCGEAEADRIFGDRRRISAPQQRAEEAIWRRIEEEITAKGYCTRDDLRRIRSRYRDREGIQRRMNMDRVFDDMRSEIEERYRYGAPNAEIRRRIPGLSSGREWIITKKDMDGTGNT